MIVNYFLILVALLLVSGLALDAGLLEWRNIALQTAADAAAQEAMSQLARNDSGWAAAGQAQAANNGFTNGANGVTVTIINPPTSGTYSGKLTAVQATVSQTVNNVFMSLINAEKSTIAATAIANILPTCVWIMSAAGVSGDNALHLASSSMNGYPGCGIYVNTAAPGSNLGVDYFSNLYGNRIRAFGPSANNGSSGNVYPTPRFGAAQKNDPLAYVTAPTFSSCTYTNYSVGSGNTYTISPGTYCGGITINNATVTFNPGLYIVTGGMSWQKGTVYGTGVTIYLTKGGGSNYANVSISQMNITMSAPTTSTGGGIVGVLLFADRGWVDHNNRDVGVHDSTLKTDGFWYVLNTGMTTSNNSFSGTNYLGFVIDSFYQYTGNTNPSANYAPLSNVSPLHYDDGALVQ